VLNLKIQETHVPYARTEAGFSLSKTFATNFGRWTPESRLSYVRESRFGSKTFKAYYKEAACKELSVKSFKPSRNLGAVGLGLNGFFYTEALTVSLKYEGEFGNKYVSHEGGVQFKYGF
jgi:uncharacterized protein with beta-barrel porin domain